MIEFYLFSFLRLHAVKRLNAVSIKVLPSSTLSTCFTYAHHSSGLLKLCHSQPAPGQQSFSDTCIKKREKNKKEKALGRIINGLFPFFLFNYFFLIEGIRPSWHKVTFPTVIPARRQNCCLDRSQSPALPLQLCTQARPLGQAERWGRRAAAHLPAQLSPRQGPPDKPTGK